MPTKNERQKVTEKKPEYKNTAAEIVTMISNDINMRNGIGSVWRQFNNDRKTEMLDIWRFKVEELLVAKDKEDK